MRACMYTLLLTGLLTAEFSCSSEKYLDNSYHDILRPAKSAWYPIDDSKEKNEDQECVRRCMMEEQYSKTPIECFQPPTWPPCETIETIFL